MKIPQLKVGQRTRIKGHIVTRVSRTHYSLYGIHYTKSELICQLSTQQ